MKYYLLIIFFFTILKAQSNIESIVAGNKGYNFGGIFNIYDNGIDLEAFANTENKYGVYANIWFGQIDYYTNTQLISNYSFGMSNALSKILSFDLGIGQNIIFENEIKRLTEVYIGLDVIGFSLYAFFEDESLEYEAWFKPSLGILNKTNLNILLYSSFDQGGYETSIDVSNQLNQKLITGLIFGYESFKETINYQKGDDLKTFSITNNYNRVFLSIYLGLLYN
jgi:hypothetical protein